MRSSTYAHTHTRSSVMSECAFDYFRYVVISKNTHTRLTKKHIYYTLAFKLSTKIRIVFVVVHAIEPIRA